MVLVSSSSYIVGDGQTKKEIMKLKKDIYEKDGKYVESDGHPKDWAGQGCHIVARAGQEVDENWYKSLSIKAKAPKENKSK